jgi:hypothetical protein
MEVRRLLVVLYLGSSTACGTEPAAEPAARADIAAPVAAPTEKSEISSRVDAMLADAAKQEAEYKSAEAEIAARERLKPLPVVADEARPTAVAPPAATVAPATATSVAAPVATTAVQYGGHDEAWWKNEMRTLQVRLQDDVRKFDAALVAWRHAIDQMNSKSVAIATTAQQSANRSEREVQQLKAVLQADRDAIERLREDARRADVPPGWLRWP